MDERLVERRTDMEMRAERKEIRRTKKEQTSLHIVLALVAAFVISFVLVNYSSVTAYASNDENSTLDENTNNNDITDPIPNTTPNLDGNGDNNNNNNENNNNNNNNENNNNNVVPDNTPATNPPASTGSGDNNNDNNNNNNDNNNNNNVFSDPTNNGGSNSENNVMNLQIIRSIYDFRIYIPVSQILTVLPSGTII